LINDNFFSQVHPREVARVNGTIQIVVNCFKFTASKDQSANSNGCVSGKGDWRVNQPYIKKGTP